MAIDPRRRRVLTQGVGLAALLAMGSGAALFVRRGATASPWTAPGPYGPLVDAVDGTTGRVLLKLPQGFSVRSLAWSGDPMEDGAPMPDRHDGMAVVRAEGGALTLIRNHERNLGPRVGEGGEPVACYDRAEVPLLGTFGGGCTATVVSADGRARHRSALAGTLVNCAGGPTPWGSWLSCEEIVLKGDALGALDHGFVFEVTDPWRGAASPRPIHDMGWMRHEAAAVNPGTGAVYLTEDAGPDSGLYRFLPKDPRPQAGALARGGRLQMLAVHGQDGADLDRPAAGARMRTRWVDVPDPRQAPAAWSAAVAGLPEVLGSGPSGPWLQGRSAGAARFVRLEGAWWREGRLWFTDTAGGEAGSGVLWSLEDSPRGGQLTAVFVARGETHADHVDNVTLSPVGGVLMCEDGGGRDEGGGGRDGRGGSRLLSLDEQGAAFAFAENACVLEAPLPGRPTIDAGDYRSQEFAGACFAPDGRTLFVNIQTPGVTLAITGPFERGPLGRRVT
ncbi:MAG TPA: alkaline phosphatase PhoX [Pseudomonadales bacterium]|nr:alkaline phosphatase PhoX [Pseudomonadales bacterium]